jgi:hypothetical protein
MEKIDKVNPTTASSVSKSRPVNLQLQSNLTDLNRPLPSSHIMQLQKTLGNKAVLQMMQSRNNQAQSVPSQLMGENMNSNEQGFFAIADAVAEEGNVLFANGNCIYPNLGFTSNLRDFDGPDINYHTEEKDQGWTASPEFTDSSIEGENDSWSLAAGRHAVPNMLIEEKPLFVSVGEDMAASIKEAEDEHNGDFTYAKEQILDKVDAWMENRANIGEDEYGPGLA